MFLETLSKTFIDIKSKDENLENRKSRHEDGSKERNDKEENALQFHGDS